MQTLKAFIKPFDAPQGSVKKKINLIFISMQLSEMHGTGRVKAEYVFLLSPNYRFLNCRLMFNSECFGFIKGRSVNIKCILHL